MQSELRPATVSSAALWTGRVLSFLPALLLLFDAVMKLMKPPFVVEGTLALGYAEGVIVPLGIALLVCTVLFLVPPTAVLGAILLTGYLGGAVASHVRHGDSPFQIFFPAIFGAVLWGGLWLRDKRLRSLVPWRSGKEGNQNEDRSRK